MMPAARCARTMRARRKRKKQRQSRVLLYSTIHNLGWLLETQLRKQKLSISVDRPVDVGRAVQLYDVYSSTCTHRGQRSIFTLIANSGSLHKFDNSCTARIFSLHDFQTILNAKAYGIRALWFHKLKIDLPPDPGPVSGTLVQPFSHFSRQPY